MTLPPRKLPHQRVLSCFIGGAAALPIDPNIEVPELDSLMSRAPSEDDSPDEQPCAWYLRQEGYL